MSGGSRRPARALVALLILSLAGGLPGAVAAQELGLPGAPQSAPAEAPAEGATEREVEAELDVGQDRRIEERLRATFGGVEALRGIGVAVNAGSCA